MTLPCATRSRVHNRYALTGRPFKDYTPHAASVCSRVFTSLKDHSHGRPFTFWPETCGATDADAHDLLWEEPTLKIALIAPNGDEHASGLGIGIDKGQVVDVTRAVEVARSRPTGPTNLPSSRTLEEYLNASDDERRAVEDLVDWALDLLEDEARSAGIVRRESDVRFRPPVPNPNQFLCVGKNYLAHLDELKRTDLIREIPDEPTGFIKLNSVISGHGDSVPRPRGIVEFDYEPELAFVIGRPTFRVSRENAMDHVFGVTLFNDLTAREVQRRELRSGTRFWTAKNMRGCGPIGPYVITLDQAGDVDDLDIECWVNGQRRMRFNTSGQIHKIPDIVAHFSKTIPLQPGDLFATGSAAGVAVGQPNAAELFLRPGDEVEVVLDGHMTLRNTIVEDE